MGKKLELFACFRDGAVLQRDKPVAVWGWAQPGSAVKVSFLGSAYESITDESGAWKVLLSPTPAGGPHEMIITAPEEKIVIRDILCGDVYLASGQSNIELPLSRTLDRLGAEVGKINNPDIRQFRVPISYSFAGPQDRISGGSWMPATGDNVLGLGAIVHFFASALNEKYGVPIGIINTGVGGSPIEAWLSETYLRKAGGNEDDLDNCKDDSWVQKVMASEAARQNGWYERLKDDDKGFAEPLWSDARCNDSDWKTAKVPFYFRNNYDLNAFHGSAWFRKTVVIPENADLDGVMLFLGAIIDADEVFINGQVSGKTEYMYPPRRYLVPAGVLRHGDNLISIRLLVNRGSGGFVAGKKYELRGKNWEVDLSGDWKYAIGAEVEELPQTTFFQYKPCGLFNAMFMPLVPYCFSGILWYQGESNTGRSGKYAEQFGELVLEWREALRVDLPVLYVQLPNFDDPTGKMPVGEWAEMREAQRKGLSLSNTAMVVAIDAGEANDLHPQDKKTVGERLALCALSLVYGEKIEWSGPVCTSAVFEAKEKRVKLSFSHIGGGLVLRNAPSRYFEARSEGKAYVPVTATIEGDILYLDCACFSSSSVPALVRYAGCNNPENPDLYNRAQLPASPFEIAVGPFGVRQKDSPFESNKLSFKIDV